MAMSRKDMIGVAIVVGLAVLFCLLLMWTIRPMGRPHRPEESPLVQQRLINLQKGK